MSIHVKKGMTIRKAWANLPKTTAVVLTVPTGEKHTYAKVMPMARKKISLEEIEIPYLEMKRARTGNLILWVPGENSAAKANSLASRLVEVVQPYGAWVTRPAKRAVLRIEGLDEIVPTSNIAAVAAIAALGGCPDGEVKVGEIRRIPSGSGQIWAQCPIKAAIRVAKVGEVGVG